MSAPSRISSASPSQRARRQRLTRWLNRLAGQSLPNVFNPWHEDNPDDLHTDGAEQRIARLRAHLDNADTRLILVGEAAGHLGAKYSGIPFTSERLLTEGRIPRLDAWRGKRLSSRNRPYSEPSATTIWGTLAEVGLAERAVLWNAFPWHPFADRENSNRTPSRGELELGLGFLEQLVGFYGEASLVAVGRKAEASLAELSLPFTPVRHPSMGGATAFRSGLAQLANALPDAGAPAERVL